MLTAQQLYGNPRIDFIRSYLASVELTAVLFGIPFDARKVAAYKVYAQQLYGNPRIDFIRSYLASVERYAKKDGSQFVSGTPEKGASFVESVARCIAGSGIDAARIVTDYGVTEGSVRIPVAVLSKDLKTAELGVWCEYPVGKKYDYFDYNARYFSTLTQRGWNLHKIYIHDWYDNAEVEKNALRAAVDKYGTK